MSPWQAAKLRRIAQDDYSVQFALSLALKDVHLALEAAGDDRFRALACLADEWQDVVEHRARRPRPYGRHLGPRGRRRRASTLIGPATGARGQPESCGEHLGSELTFELSTRSLDLRSFEWIRHQTKPEQPQRDQLRSL